MSFSFQSHASAALVATGAMSIIAVAALAGAAQAQHQHGATPPAALAPANTSAVTSAARPFRSIMDGYQRFDAGAPLTDWRKANDTVRDIGGWQAYAKQSAAEIAQEKSRGNADLATPKGPEK